MSKKSRTFQPPTASGGAPNGGPASPPGPAPDPAMPSITSATSAATGASTSSTSPAGTSSATSRSSARRKAAGDSKVGAPPTFFERYRLLIVGAIAVALIAGAAWVINGVSSTSAGAFACESLMTPGPTDPVPTPKPATAVPTGAEASTDPGASPAPTAASESQPTQRLGFTTEDLGRGHIDPSHKQQYGFCPPTGGPHYNVGGGIAPLARDFYPPTQALGPGNWIHNLEHGYVVLLYKGPITDEVQQQLRDIMAGATPSGYSSANCGYSKVIAVRFDDMDPGVNFAAVAWDRALLLDQFDKQAFLTFANQWQDGPQTPEPGLC